MADLLEYYMIHISQLSPLGMVCARHFEYCFRLEVRSVFQHIPKEMMTIPTTQEWYETLQVLLLVVVSYRGLIDLCMMLLL
ncbi:hypothetical protein Hanom_Chr14g01271621 [Helianthus anomalus]